METVTDYLLAYQACRGLRYILKCQKTRVALWTTPQIDTLLCTSFSSLISQVLRQARGCCGELVCMHDGMKQHGPLSSLARHAKSSIASHAVHSLAEKGSEHMVTLDMDPNQHLVEQSFPMCFGEFVEEILQADMNKGVAAAANFTMAAAAATRDSYQDILGMLGAVDTLAVLLADSRVEIQEKVSSDISFCVGLRCGLFFAVCWPNSS